MTLISKIRTGWTAPSSVREPFLIALQTGQILEVKNLLNGNDIAFDTSNAVINYDATEGIAHRGHHHTDLVITIDKYADLAGALAQASVISG